MNMMDYGTIIKADHIPAFEAFRPQEQSLNGSRSEESVGPMNWRIRSHYLSALGRLRFLQGALSGAAWVLAPTADRLPCPYFS